MQYALSNPSRILEFYQDAQRKESMRDCGRNRPGISYADIRRYVRFAEHHLGTTLRTLRARYGSRGRRSWVLATTDRAMLLCDHDSPCEGTEDGGASMCISADTRIGRSFTMICDCIGYRKYGDEAKSLVLGHTV